MLTTYANTKRDHGKSQQHFLETATKTGITYRHYDYLRSGVLETCAHTSSQEHSNSGTQNKLKSEGSQKQSH